jgi:phosphatidylethanolamine N-methyltransferase
LSPKKTQVQLPSSPSSYVSLGDLAYRDADAGAGADADAADAADEEEDDDVVDGHDPDDFSIMDENQARRITSLCEMAFGVQISVDVVVADANVGVLARRVVGARSLVAASVAKGSG